MVDGTTQARPPPTVGEDFLPVGAPPPVDLGTAIARYVVLERIGAGGMGVVYAAYDPELDRKVAIKLLQPDAEADASSLGRARLLREAQALARLTHPNVVAVHDVGTWAQRVFVAMEFVHGVTLGRWLQASKRTPREIVDVFLQAGAGLRAAHDAGLMHRDFKPDNVMIGDDGRVRVLDFGLARTAGSPALELEAATPASIESSERSSRVDSRITRTGAMAGTPAYMAPEQHRGDEVDPRADQFSFCVALWEGLCGERPFSGGDRIGLALAVCAGQRRPIPAHVSIPTRWRRAIERGLAPDPAARFPSMAPLLAEFAPRRSPLAIVLAGGALLTAAAAFAAARPSDAACDTAGAKLAEVWDRDRAASVTEAFTAAHPQLGPDTAVRVGASLDAYARGWVAAAQDACAATHVRHEQSEALLDRRAACLGERLGAMELLVERFVAADAEVVSRAVDATAALPELGRCADSDALLSAIPPPEDPELAAEVIAVRQAIAQAEIGGRVGRYAATWAEAPALVERARRTGHRPVVAEAELVAGDLAAAADHDAEGIRYLEDAVLSAIASGHDRVHVRAATRLVKVVGLGQSRYDEALGWARQAGAALQRVGYGGPEEAETSETMCKVLADKGDVALAQAYCVRALELAEALWGVDDPRTARALEAVGIAHFAGGQYAEAEAAFVRVEALVRRDKGEEHPDHAQITNALAGTCYYLRGAAPCVASFERAVAAAQRSLGEDQTAVADLTNNLALVLVEVGRLDEAEAHARRALAIRRRVGVEHPGMAASLSAIGQVEAARGRTEAANAALDEALAIYRRTRGPVHPDVLATLRTAAAERVRQGDVATARAQLREAIDVARSLRRPEAELAELRGQLAAI